MVPLFFTWSRSSLTPVRMLPVARAKEGSAFLLCSDCNVGAHTKCLEAAARKRRRKSNPTAGAALAPAPAPVPEAGGDWLCGYCARDLTERLDTA